MQKSDSIGALSKALTAVQAQIKPAIKDANNPFFKSKYADLNSVWDSCRELLAANGLSIVQGNSVGEIGTVIVETILTHESGEWIQSELALPLAKHDPQGVGSAITYGRRYGLAAIVGIVSDTDDDGNAASHTPKQYQQQAKPTIAVTPRPATESGLLKDINDLLLIKCGDGETVDEVAAAAVLNGRDLSLMNAAGLSKLKAALAAM